MCFGMLIGTIDGHFSSRLLEFGEMEFLLNMAFVHLRWRAWPYFTVKKETTGLYPLAVSCPALWPLEYVPWPLTFMKVCEGWCCLLSYHSAGVCKMSLMLAHSNLKQISSDNKLTQAGFV